MKNNDVMAEDAGDDTPASGSPDGDYQQQTVQIPISACPDTPKPGAMLQFKVVSVDQNAGTVNAVCVEPEEEQGGSDSLAAEFNQQPT
jgi:hypothetical protein